MEPPPPITNWQALKLLVPGFLERYQQYAERAGKSSLFKNARFSRNVLLTTTAMSAICAATAWITQDNSFLLEILHQRNVSHIIIGGGTITVSYWLGGILAEPMVEFRDFINRENKRLSIRTQ